MKKISKFIFVLLFSFVLFGFISCQTKNSLVSISINRKANKSVYFEGEIFDPTGMQVMAKYTKEKDKNVTSSITYSDAPLTTAHTFIVISYTEGKETKTVNFPIQVLADNLELLYIDHQPNKLVYQIGEIFDPTGMVIKGFYTNSGEVEITDYTINRVTPLTINDFQIVISYTEKGKSMSINIPIAVEKIDLLAINITSQPTKLLYNVGETLDISGLVVKAIYSTSTIEEVTPTSISFSGVLNVPGEVIIVVSFTNLGKTVTASFKIFVLE